MASMNEARRRFQSIISVLGTQATMCACIGCRVDTITSAKLDHLKQSAGNSADWGVVDTISALKEKAPQDTTNPECFMVLGYHTPGDGGGGVFYWDHTAADNDDGGTVLEPINHPGSGRWKRLFAGGVSVRWFGAKGDAITDDTLAIHAALSHATVVHIPRGVYRCTDGLDIPSGTTLRGEGAPRLGPFPLFDDDKRFLRPGQKHLLPGSVLLFSGAGSKMASTQRSDQFQQFTYCVKSPHLHPTSVEGVGIVLDVNIQDENGQLTTPVGDMRAHYDVGYFIDNAYGCYHRDLTVFGYFRVAGIVISSRANGLFNPDYNRFFHGSTMGEIGVALIGDDLDTNGTNGLSGTQFFSFDLFANDHHDRSADQWGTACLYIDGDTLAARANLNGTYLFGGQLRTYTTHPIQLDKASNVVFHGTVFETPTRNTPNSQPTAFLATENTYDVHFFGCRFADDAGLTSFRRCMKGTCTVIESGDGAISSSLNGVGMRFITEPSTGNPVIQLTDDFESINNGWTMRVIRNQEGQAEDALDIRFANSSKLRITKDGQIEQNAIVGRTGDVLTISSGAIQISQAFHKVKTANNRSTDDLYTINGGIEGQQLLLAPYARDQHIAVRDRAGNIRLANRRDFVMTDGFDRMLLVFDGRFWIEVSRSSNG